MMEVISKEESYRIMGSCFEVYRELGCGFLEAVYQECLEIEFTSQGIPFVPQAELGLTYNDRGLKQKYFADPTSMHNITLELNARTELTDAHRAQVHDYLKATGLRLALLVNFGHYPMLEHERIV